MASATVVQSTAESLEMAVSFSMAQNCSKSCQAVTNGELTSSDPFLTEEGCALRETCWQFLKGHHRAMESRPQAKEHKTDGKTSSCDTAEWVSSSSTGFLPTGFRNL